MQQLQRRRSVRVQGSAVRRPLINYLGHVTLDCKNNRVFDMSAIADATADVAWENLQKADEDKDLDEIREVRRFIRCHACSIQ